MHLRSAALAAAVMLAVGACGGGGPEETAGSGATTSSAASGSPASPAPPATEAPARIDVPDTVLTDVADGREVALRSLVPSERPILFWFWAPHWVTCAGEAPGLEQFAREHADELTVVGVGTQDSFGDAEEFVARHSITFPMLWEDGFASWQGFGIQRQPASILVSGGGTQLQRWQGALNESEHAEVLRAIGAT